MLSDVKHKRISDEAKTDQPLNQKRRIVELHILHLAIRLYEVAPFAGAVVGLVEGPQAIAVTEARAQQGGLLRGVGERNGGTTIEAFQRKEGGVGHGEKQSE